MHLRPVFASSQADHRRAYCMGLFRSPYDPFDFSFELARTVLTDHPIILSFGTPLKVFVSGSLVPVLPQVAKDLGSDVATVRYACLMSFILLAEEIPSWAVSVMLFTASFTGMTWATYAAFCELSNRSAQTAHLDCCFPQTAGGSCTCIPCRV